MTKIWIRKLFPFDKHCWGKDQNEMIRIRKALNDLGFYVLTGHKDTLDVYAIKTKSWIERWFL